MIETNRETELLAMMARNVTELQDQLGILNRLMHGGEAVHMEPQGLSARPEGKDREKRLQAAIVEAINELEESRKSFKSKRLEQLRKRLTQVILETG